MSNVFETITKKRESYKYEQEVRLVYWSTSDLHDALVNNEWNEAIMRFDNLVDDARPIRAGISLKCDLDALIECVIVSPFAPPWFVEMIMRLRDQLGCSFSVKQSMILNAPLRVN